jgi:hypothetical protein
MSTLTLNPTSDGHVTPGPEITRVDARALPAGVVVRLRGGARCTTLLLPEDRTLDLEIDRDLDAAPLRIEGRVGTVGGRVGLWRIAPVYLTESRRVGRGGYVGPADRAPSDELAVRVCFGPGALAAAARGVRGLVRLALDDALGERFDLPDTAEPPALVQIERCPRLREVNVAPSATRLWLEQCPALRIVHGEGPIAHLRSCGGTGRLDAVGEWRFLALRGCPSAELRTRATSIYTQDPTDWIRSLRGADVHRGDLPDFPLPPPPQFPKYRPYTFDRTAMHTLPGDRTWPNEILAHALGPDGPERTQALHWIHNCGVGIAIRIVQLRAALEAGVPLERLWEVRRRLAPLDAIPRAPIRAGNPPRRGDPSDSPLESLEPWLAELALLEATCEVDATSLDADGRRSHESPAAQASALAADHPLFRLRLLAEGRAERLRRGNPVTWVDALIRETLVIEASEEPDHEDPPWPRRRVHHGSADVHAHVALELLGDPTTGDPSLLEAFLEWLHHRWTGTGGVPLLYIAALNGHARAHALLAEVALDGGAWAPEDRAEALRCVLRGPMQASHSDAVASS